MIQSQFYHLLVFIRLTLSLCHDILTKILPGRLRATRFRLKVGNESAMPVCSFSVLAKHANNHILTLSSLF